MEPTQPLKPQFLEVDEDRGEPPIWQTIKLYSGPYATGYLLNAVEMQKTPDGIGSKPETQRVYLQIVIRTSG